MKIPLLETAKTAMCLVSVAERIEIFRMTGCMSRLMIFLLGLAYLDTPLSPSQGSMSFPLLGNLSQALAEVHTISSGKVCRMGLEVGMHALISLLYLLPEEISTIASSLACYPFQSLLIKIITKRMSLL